MVVNFSNKKNDGIWQRPRLFCTTEDLFTQSIVVPYLIPMLENAGAVVFTPRERDWQRNEVIVDNNSRGGRSIYLEENYRKNHWQEIKDKGFAQRYATYPDGTILLRMELPDIFLLSAKKTRLLHNGFRIFRKQASMLYM